MVFVFFLVACGGDVAGVSRGGRPPETGVDAGSGEGIGVDAGVDVGADSGADAGSVVDADSGVEEDAGSVGERDAGVIPDAGAWTRADAGARSATLQLASSGAGTEGVALRVTWPATAAGARYATGAPVVIEISGGHGPGDLPAAAQPKWAESGFVSISFMFPGGTSGTARSGGTYDYRGTASIQALADVVQFATGRKRAKSGTTGRDVLIADLVGYDVLTQNVGLLALSNGGNIAAVALSTKPTETAGVGWFVGWENPAGDQFIGTELSDRTGANPAYTPNSCVGTTCTVDRTNLKVDTSQPLTLNDSATPRGSGSATMLLEGTPFFDASTLNGRFDVGEFRLAPNAIRLTPGGALRAIFSVETTEALDQKGIRPASSATLAEAQTFWRLRDPAYGGHWATAVQNHASLAVMLTATAQDHVQGTPDHPHIKVQYDGWRSAGARFVRLNPDRAYVIAAGCTTSVDFDANRALAWADVVPALEPDSVERCLNAAAIREMADRTAAARWDTNLAATLWR